MVNKALKILNFYTLDDGFMVCIFRNIHNILLIGKKCKNRNKMKNVT